VVVLAPVAGEVAGPGREGQGARAGPVVVEGLDLDGAALESGKVPVRAGKKSFAVIVSCSAIACFAG
jgi:hypothetical protein